jgi:hypothetical protein
MNREEQKKQLDEAGITFRVITEKYEALTQGVDFAGVDPKLQYELLELQKQLIQATLKMTTLFSEYHDIK